MMVRDLDTTFWGKRYEELNINNDEHLEAVGISRKERRRKKQENANYNAEEAYRSKGIHVEGCNARQAFQMFKGNNTMESFAEVDKCRQAVPEDINVYSDGSYKNNRRVYFSLAGAGVW